NWTLFFGLVLLYQFTPLKIEWFGLVVIGIYIAVYYFIATRRGLLVQS
ncbi:MAG: glycine betaine transporter, partial [Cryomorphaceae bacterium]